MTTWLAVVRAERWLWAAALAVALMAVALVQRATVVTIPMVDWLVPTPVLVALVTATVGLLPLYSNFGVLETTLVRTSSMRPVRLGGAVGLVLVGCWPALSFDATLQLACLLTGAGITAVVVIGDFAWVVGLTLGFAAVVMDGSPRRPVTSLLQAVPPAVWICVVVAAGVLYWVAGPRETR